VTQNTLNCDKTAIRLRPWEGLTADAIRRAYDEGGELSGIVEFGVPVATDPKVHFDVFSGIVCWPEMNARVDAAPGARKSASLLVAGFLHQS